MWGPASGGCKTTGIDPRVLSRAVIYDTELTSALPVAMSVASELNAMAHAVDAMWGPGTDPVDVVLAHEGIHALGIGLPQMTSNPRPVTPEDVRHLRAAWQGTEPAMTTSDTEERQ